MISIHFNGKPTQTASTTLSELLAEQGFDATSHVATAVNGNFVAKTARDSHIINEGDQIEVVAPMQGG